MSVVQARNLLPYGSIIGVSCNNEDHVRAAVRDGADYVGIGAVWGTQTKKLTNPILGVRKVGAMLEILDGTNLKAVAIGTYWESSSAYISAKKRSTFRRY
jgi:thiamine-phosphate diphosphorylase/hydroxyethylthiazole kinase